MIVNSVLRQIFKLHVTPTHQEHAGRDFVSDVDYDAYSEEAYTHPEHVC